MMRTRSPLHTAPPTRLANPWAIVSCVLAVIGAILAGLEVALLAVFNGHAEDVIRRPLHMSRLLPIRHYPGGDPGGGLLVHLPRVGRSPRGIAARWGRALGFLAIVLGLIGAYLFVGASLNTIGP